MSNYPDSRILEQARKALSAHDPEAVVEIADGGGLRVHSRLDEGTVLGLLQTAAIPVAKSATEGPSDCCGGCC